MTRFADALAALDTPRYKELLLLPAHRDKAPLLGVINYRAGWRDAGRPGSFEPVGGVFHHTAISGPGLATCVNGRPDLPGPLVQVNTARSGLINVIAAGRCNHAGACSSVVLAELAAGSHRGGDARARGLNDNDGGNGRLCGVEMDFSGVPIGGHPIGGLHPEAWSWQLVAALYYATVVSRHMGWTGKHWAGHRCITGRKPDPAYGAGAPYPLESTVWMQAQVDRGLAILAAPPPSAGPVVPPVAPDTPASSGRAGLLYRDAVTGAIYLVEGVTAKHIGDPAVVRAYLAAGYGPQLDAEPELAALLASNTDD